MPSFESPHNIKVISDGYLRWRFHNIGFSEVIFSELRSDMILLSSENLSVNFNTHMIF
ncbi:hypothetical protein KAU32_08690 [bacterium]|nr:hypothetical protein [bacterium]